MQPLISILILPSTQANLIQTSVQLSPQKLDLTADQLLIRLIIDMETESVQNSQEQSMIYTTSELSPKDFIQLIDLLKSQGMSEADCKFVFKSSADHKQFKRRLKAEGEVEQEFDSHLPKRKPEIKQSIVEKDHSFTNKYKLMIGSCVRTKIFMKAYAKKIRQLETEQNASITQGGRNVIIQSKGGLNRILFDEMMAMFSRLKIYHEYRNFEIWEAVKSSRLVVAKLQKSGIFCFKKHFNSLKQTVFFYSTELEEEEMKRIISRNLSEERKILNFYDTSLKYLENLKIFELLVRNVRGKVEEIISKYETVLEINPETCCFILHMKHETFAQEPIAELQEEIMHYTFLSFSIRRALSFVNSIKRDPSHEKYLKVSYHRNNVFCCVNKQTLHKKHVIPFFSRFLEQLSNASRLKVHLKFINTVQPNSHYSQQILDLISQCKLQCTCYEKILEKVSHNIAVKLKNVGEVNEKNKLKRRMQFANFLLKLFDLSATTEQFTAEEMNEAFINDHNVYSVTQGPANNLFQGQQSSLPSKQQDRLNQQAIKSQIYKLGTFIEHTAQKWESCQQCSYIKAEKNIAVQKLIYDCETMKFRVWNLKINKTIFDVNILNDSDKQKCYLVKQIVGSQGEKVNNPQIIQFASIKSNEQAFLVYFKSDQSEYVPAFLIKAV